MNTNNRNLCRHFGECGGCRYQDTDYSVQLQQKEAVCRDLIKDSGMKVSLRPIVPSPRTFYYRNKMEFTFAEEDSGIICGLHHREVKRRVIDVTECLIFSEDASQILAVVRALARESKLPAYDSRTHRGFWRNLVLREGKFTGQLLVNLVTSSQGELDEAALKSRILSLPTSKRVVSLIWTINDRLSDAVIMDQINVIEGQAYLEEKVEGLIFRIPPASFFQVNPFILENFYQELRQCLALQGDEKILDVFSGLGTISLVLSRQSESITGIEREEETVEGARRNAALNNLTNVTFLAGPAQKVLLANRDKWHKTYEVVIINPPRAGISKKVVKRIREIAPRLIVYSSCNPKTFFAQAGLLFENYRLDSIRPFDFFPHTPHLEILGLFTRN